MDRQAALVARWQLVGFIHGVMNTDNMAISGETIDYGPCAFMNAYHPDTVFSSIDHARPLRLRQPARHRAVEPGPLRRDPACRSWIPTRRRRFALATEVLGDYPALFERYWLAGMRKKLGLQTRRGRRRRVDSMRCSTGCRNPGPTSPTRSATSRRSRWPASGIGIRTSRPGTRDGSIGSVATGKPIAAVYAVMRTVNPAVIPRNHRVEEALSAAEEHDDLSVLHRLLAVLRSPHELGRDLAHFREPGPEGCALPDVLRHLDDRKSTRRSWLFVLAAPC